MNSPNYTPESDNQKSNPSPNYQENESDTIIMCEDHMKNLNEDLEEADRYCLQCKYPLCSFCVVEFHSSHVHMAKIKLIDFLKEKKKEVEDLRMHIFSNNDHKKIVANICDHIENYDKVLEEGLCKRRIQLNEIKETIDKIIMIEGRLVEEIKEKTKSAYQEMYNEKLKKYIDKSNENSLQIINLSDSWDATDNNEKIAIIKKNFISKLREDSKLNKNILDMEVDGVKSNIISLLDYVKKFRENAIKNTSAVGIECEVKSIFNCLREKYDYVQKCDVVKASKIMSSGYDDFEVRNKSNFEKAEENFMRNNSYVQFNNRNANNIFDNNQQKDKDKFSVFDDDDGKNKKDLQNAKSNSDNNIYYKDKSSDNNNTPGAGEFNNNNAYNSLKDNDILQTGFAMQNQFSYEFVIAIKPNSKTIKLYDQEITSPFTFELENKMFQDPNCVLEKFPTHCKFVNLGFTLLITGGITEEGVSISNCFLLMITKKNPKSSSKENYEISIMPYSPMLEGRERHCLVNLHDKNKVLACCGFAKNSAEITCLESGQWKKLDSMRESRANASIAYTDNRFVWVFGGFKLVEGSKNGVYLNSAEVFDSSNENAKWTFIDFALLSNPIKITAAGIVNFNKGKMLLCGGYDGNVYSKDVYCVEFDDDKIEKYEKTKLSLTNENIYFHSNFVKCGGYGVNFDYKMDLNQYNPLTREFKVFK